MPDKIDFKRELPCYRAGRTPQVVDVPDLQYLVVDGHGDPNTPAYTDAVSTLYPVAYGLKTLSRTSLDRDFVVMPLEGLWWAEDMSTFTTARDKSRWDWTMMILAPPWVTTAMVAEAVERVGRKKRPPRLDDLRLESLSEGRCVQVLHVGGYDDETALLRRVHEEFIPGRGLTMTGRHHEIYLGDPRRTDPAKLRTILRQPVLDTRAADRHDRPPDVDDEE
ncbi:GyrI-like domain-containing protein [Pseudonocardia sp. KRD-184]|uniref:GyrI-like domain-containing protein n=1 Tax=Pseudonocardia oceani TaxID=2792013 RepID=A0ABS6U740_9PSEU|nr:GyrI-like domain-containing protein [Pseudonocardia oceani]MBW0092943.1 GyrI-like domain-containing protein [Pseudonocardia oceani]MBW0099753.1 GyrI-like domain-containing protein [Pseudonocardia oceani]MBW0112406.1 GyrI-like domain-containing protein [Pseudonocardia oceani]MBW0125652.1 GyrI-like domain-containing protein [Pseudonocardia oceani]MBW0128050.1 GyrI-like domain-containing protein [Pseudonocardia oceani]